MKERSMTHRPLPRQAMLNKRAKLRAPNTATTTSPKNYHEVVNRLTKEPLAKIELKIAIENKSYDMQVKNMQMVRSRHQMYDEDPIASVEKSGSRGYDS